MTDMILQHVDSLLVERIRVLARERQWTVNDVMLHALRNGLGVSAAQEYSESSRDPQALMTLSGQWNLAEVDVFEEAMHALARARPTQLAPENIRVAETVGGAE